MGPKETRWLKRTVLIGLGGTGKETLLRVKKKYLEVFGELPPLLHFLLIDTTAAATDTIRAEAADGRLEEVHLEASEVLFIEARGASMLPKTHDEIRTWFPPKADLKSNIISGAGQIRALGRLALFANAHSVYEGLRALLSQARDYRVERPDIKQRFVYQAYSPHLTVCVIGSLAGGTGSGIFLDVAMILRDILKDEDQLFAYLLLPDIYVNRPGTQNVEANAYAALRELDHFMSLETTYRYSFGGREIELRKRPFDMVFLVNNRNRAGKTFNEIENMAELLGLGAFLVSGPLGKEQADVFDNIVMQLTEQQGAFYGKRAHFASFGAAELRFRPQRVDLDVARSVAKEAVDRLCSPGEQEWGVTELERKLHAALDTELPKHDPQDLPMPRASSSREEDEQAWQKAVEAFRRLEDYAREDGMKSLRAAISDFEQQLEQQLARDFGDYPLPALAKGLDKLRGVAAERYQKAEEDLEAEEKSREERRAQIAKDLKIKRRFPWFWNRDNEDPRVDRRTIVQGWESARSIGHKRARLEAAQELERAVTQRKERLEHLLRTIKNWLEHFSGKSETAAVSLPQDVLPFTVTLPPPYMAVEGAFPAGSASEGIKGLKEKGFAQLCENPDRVLDEVFRPKEAASLRDWLIEVQKRDGNDPLRQAVERAIRELDALSAPAWDYKDEWLANPYVARRELVHIIGVENKNDDKHPLLVGELRKIIAGNIDATRRLAEVSTGDPYRIYLYKIEASIPAFTLQGIEMYRERYLSLSHDRSFHIDRQLEQQIPELVPMPSDEETAVVWTKALVFGLIDYHQETSTFRRMGQRDSGQEGWHELGKSPGEAFTCLQRDFFGFKEVEAKVKEKEQEASRKVLQKLREKVAEALEHSKGQLERARSAGNGTRPSTPEDQRVWEATVKVLEQWAQELESFEPPDSYAPFPTLGEL